MSRKRSISLVTGALIPLVIAGNVLFGAGASAGTLAARPAVARPAAASPAVGAAARLEAEALRLARLASAGRNKPRIGWFVPVVCYCLQANEKTFQDALQAVFNVAAPIDKMSVRVQPKTYMKLSPKARTRIPDIYYFALDKAHPAKGTGYINELKVGTSGMGSGAATEVSQDHALYVRGHGVGANAFNKNQYLPVTGAVWWFAPNVDGVTYFNGPFFVKMLSQGINIIYLQQDDSAQPWPRQEGQRRDARDIKEIEGNAAAAAAAAADSMFQPCPMVCRIP
jgi:hypothetical protein